MSVKRKLNEQHPDCAEYRRKFEAIWKAYIKLEEIEKAKYPDWKGLDHPANEVLCPAYHKCCEEMKELQKEYAYLFTEISEETKE